MSQLAELKRAKGAFHKKHRVGRGDSSGWGGTSGKGHKGQKARSGGSIKPGFEGGQTPLYRRLPKFGFKNTMFTKRYTVINVGDLEGVESLNPEQLKEAGKLKTGRLKILGGGELKKVGAIKAHKFSESAKKMIEAAGGTAEVVS